MDGYIIAALLAYAGYELWKAATVKQPKPPGEALAEALGVRVTALEERVKKLEEERGNKYGTTAKT